MRKLVWFLGAGIASGLCLLMTACGGTHYLGGTCVLTVNSTSPASGVSISVSPADINSASNGNTSFTRTYAPGTTVTLTAPASAGGNAFSSWTGCTTSSTVTCEVTLKANTTTTAVYAAPASITPTVTVTASPTITIAQPLTAAVVVSGVSGTPTATGSVILTSGSYASPATMLSSGSVTITVPAGSLATGNDTLTAKYTPDAASSATYTNASGNASVTVTAVASAAPTVTLSASPATITSGGSSTLTWSSTNATACTASGGWTGTEPTSGTESEYPGATTAYMLTCTGAGGSETTSATVTVAGSGTSSDTLVFAPYVDMGLAEAEQIVSDAKTAGLKTVTLAFMVDAGCVANWGGLGGTVTGATFWNGTPVSTAVNALISEDVNVIISWGGEAGVVQGSCTDPVKLQTMYQSVFDAYPNIIGQDFDIESNVDATVVAEALAGLKKANPSKLISLTLPVMPTGLVTAGLDIVNACHTAGLHPDTINVMTMDYGSGSDNNGQMGLSAEQAALATYNQTGDKIGITPDIGVNDTSTEIFGLTDATMVVDYANSNSYINRLAFWSLGRDNDGCPGQGWSSSTCSGVSQSNFQFSEIFEGTL